MLCLLPKVCLEVVVVLLRLPILWEAPLDLIGPFELVVFCSGKVFENCSPLVAGKVRFKFSLRLGRLFLFGVGGRCDLVWIARMRWSSRRPGVRDKARSASAAAARLGCGDA